jgi:hypothetical protein
MNDEEVKALQKLVRKKKRIASERASEIHDLVEDRLWTDYESLMELSKKTYDACTDWAETEKMLNEVQA